MKKIKDIISNFFSNTKIMIKNNKILFIYIIGNVLNGTILRFITVKNYFSISPILADLFVSCFFAGIYFLIKDKNKIKYLIILSFLSSFICIANIIYYHYYNSFISITFISFALTNYETGDSNVVGDLLQFKFFILLYFPILLICLNKYFHKTNKFNFDSFNYKKYCKLIYKWSLIILILFLSSLKLIDYARFYNQWNREYLVTRFGVYLYQLNDIIKSVEPKVYSLLGSDRAVKSIDEYYEENTITDNFNDYTNIFEGKNVIAIHAESIQNIVLGLEFNGVSVTPNIKKIAEEGIYFNNFYSQVSVGTSSDTEFTVATSLMPVKSGTAFVNYADKDYVSLYKLLKEKGYYIFSMHANTGDFWNRNIMYKNIGYDYFYDKNSFIIDEEIGFGLSDKSFLTQASKIIEEISSTKDKFYGTIITLSNHTPFANTDMYGEYDVSMTIDGITYPYLEGTKLGNYFKSVHYADKQIGMFIDLLDKKNLLDDTVIVLYGDHDARISVSEWDLLYNYDYTTNSVLEETDSKYQNLDYYWYEINRKVPFIIWSKDQNFQKNYSQVITKVAGMIDVSPTLANMLGVYNKYALGEDLFSNMAKENIVAFPNGNFITDTVYYNDSKNEYKLLKDVPLSENYIADCKEYSERILNVSNDIVVYNYFNQKLYASKYNDETKVSKEK